MNTKPFISTLDGKATIGLRLRNGFLSESHRDVDTFATGLLSQLLTARLENVGVSISSAPVFGPLHNFHGIVAVPADKLDAALRVLTETIEKFFVRHIIEIYVFDSAEDYWHPVRSSALPFEPFEPENYLPNDEAGK